MNEFSSMDSSSRSIGLGVTTARTKAGYTGQVVILDRSADPEIVWEGEPVEQPSDAIFDARLVLGHAIERLLADAAADLNDAVAEELAAESNDEA